MSFGLAAFFSLDPALKVARWPDIELLGLQVKNILLIQLRQLGDILLTTPCIREIKREMPNAKITFLSHSMGKLILEGNPYVDEYFCYDNKTSFLEELKIMRTLRARNFDLVIDFMNNPRSALYTRFTGCLERVAFQSRRRMAYTATVPRAKESDYIVREKFKLLREAGFSPLSENLTLPWVEKHTAPFMNLLGHAPEFRDAPLRVVLSPTHRREHRQWPKAAYAELADRLVREWKAAVIWIWGPGEESFIDATMALCQEKTIKAPPTSFREMAALIANCDLMVANSNGPSHVAVATEICSLQLHGHTMASAWCPLNDRHRAIQTGADMSQLSVATVWDSLADFHEQVQAFAAQRRQQGLRIKWTQKGVEQ